MDRITRIIIKNVRAIEYADIEISPLTVLIGENGSGKSSIVECLELLRKAAYPTFFDQFYMIHRGLPGLLRKGASALELGLVIEDDAGKKPRIEYSFSLGDNLSGAYVKSERLSVGPMVKQKHPLVALSRNGAKGEMFDMKKKKLVPVPTELMGTDQLVISSFGSLPPQIAFRRLLAVLRGIEVHLHFDTVATWAARSYQFSLSMRGSTTLLPADRLSLLGFNLANAWNELKNRDSTHWNQTMALVRLGIGDSIDSINIIPDRGGGNVAITLKRIDFADPIPAANLSDGQLAWLAFIALVRLNEGRTLLAIDEPELHLHPSLLGRVVSLLKNLNNGAPVVLSTHADRVLELLDDPVGSVRVCSFEDGKAIVLKIDKTELERWLKRFGDLGQLRDSGFLNRVLLPPPSVVPEEKK